MHFQKNNKVTEIVDQNRPRRRWRRREQKPKEKPVYLPEGHLSDFAAIDFEAANAAFTSACSMGLVIVRNDEIVERFYGLMKPVPNHYDWYNVKVHGIKKSDTEKAPVFPYLWNQVKDKVEGLPFVAHGMLFDQHVLRALYELHKIPYPDYKFYCTQGLCRHRHEYLLIPVIASQAKQSIKKIKILFELKKIIITFGHL